MKAEHARRFTIHAYLPTDRKRPDWTLGVFANDAADALDSVRVHLPGHHLVLGRRALPLEDMAAANANGIYLRIRGRSDLPPP